MTQASIQARGSKRICPNCGTKYYDFDKTPPVCPKCGTAYDPDQYLKSRRIRSSSAEEEKKSKKKGLKAVKEVAETKKKVASDGDESLDDDLDLDLEDLDIDALEDGDLADEDDLGDDDLGDVADVDLDDEKPE